MKNIKLLKPQPSPTNTRKVLSNLTNYFQSREKTEKDTYRHPSLSPRNSSRVGKSDKSSSSFGKVKDSFVDQSKKADNVKRERRAVTIGGDSSAQMVRQAQEYINSCEKVLQVVNNKLASNLHERSLLQHRFLQQKEGLEKQQQQTLAQINEQYRRMIQQKQQNFLQDLRTLGEHQEKLVQFSRQFEMIKADVLQNMKEMQGRITGTDFRKIMRIYWSRIETFNSAFFCEHKEKMTESSQVFVQKYVRPSTDSPELVCRDNNTINKGDKQAKQFTFSKMVWQAQNASSWSDPVVESSESVVEQKIKLR